MHSYVLALPVISFFLYGVNAFDDLTRRDLALDTCAEVDADLKIANSLGMSTAIGPIGTSDLEAF
jgi:hypothetical protein